MKKVLKNILIVLLGLALLGLLFFSYMGMFKTVKVTTKTVGPYTGVYEAHIGPYEQTSKTFDKVCATLKKAGIPKKRAIGVYYDNPQIVAKAKLHSDCGFIIDDKNLKAVKKLKNNELKVITFKKSESLIVSFPIRNSFSYMIGPMKAYPALMKTVRAKGYKTTNAFEIYDTKAIYFVMPIVKK